jgi:hypothetical protein
MPDAAKLIAALFIGVLGYIASILFMPLMPESTDFGNFAYVNAVIGLVVGWTVMGKRAGRGVTAAINNGFGGAFMLVLWALFLHSCGQMFDRAMDNWYNNAFDAFAAVIKFMAEYGLVMLDAKVVVALVVGGILAGLATEAAWRTWR